MRIMLQLKWNGVTLDQYKRVIELVNWETDPPKGGVLHAAAFSKEALIITDVWESAAHFQDFLTNMLLPVVKKVGLAGEPKIEIFPLQALHVPRKD